MRLKTLDPIPESQKWSKVTAKVTTFRPKIRLNDLKSVHFDPKVTAKGTTLTSDLDRPWPRDLEMA